MYVFQARIDPAKALGLQEGDAHVSSTALTHDGNTSSAAPRDLCSSLIPTFALQVIRNAGGLAREALRSLVISEQLLGTREIVVLHHTDCGMLTFTQDQAVEVVKKQTGHDAAHIAFQPFPDLEQSVRDDVAFLQGEDLIPADVAIWGGVYEVETGRVRRVE